MNFRLLLFTLMFCVFENNSKAINVIPKIPAGYVNVKTYGAKGNGSDDYLAIQRATNSGKPVYFPAGRYLLKKSIIYTGKVRWLGSGNKSVIISDGVVVAINMGSGSVIDNLEFDNATIPWVIIRNPNNLNGVPKLTRSNLKGYQPTNNDTDIWAQLTEKQKKQDIGPQISFGGKASNILINRIYGNFVSILIGDANNSIVSNCNFKGGKNIFGAILFSNCKLQNGTGNRAINNTIKYASFNGIVFIANHDGFAINNKIEYCGESGIKTYQGDIGGQNARCSKMQVLKNTSSYNFYDGFDLTTNYPRITGVFTGHIVKGNISKYNGQTGFIADGTDNQFTDNWATYNQGAGINCQYNNSKIIGNHFTDNNMRNTPTGVHEIGLTGTGNIVKNNNIVRTGNRLGYAIYTTEENVVSDNTAKNSTFFFGIGPIRKSILNNKIVN